MFINYCSKFTDKYFKFLAYDFVILSIAPYAISTLHVCNKMLLLTYVVIVCCQSQCLMLQCNLQCKLHFHLHSSEFFRLILNYHHECATYKLFLSVHLGVDIICKSVGLYYYKYKYKVKSKLALSSHNVT